jgi:ribosomal protein L37AE/L43A
MTLSTSLECPQCGKHTIVSYEPGVYKCLGCNFERNLNGQSSGQIPPAGMGEFLFTGAGFLIVVLLLL